MSLAGGSKAMIGENINGIPPMMPGIFTSPPYDQNPPKLIGGCCGDCRRYYFPRPRYCPTCLQPTKEALLNSEGTVHSFTVVRTKPPLGLPQPYSVGYVDLAESGLRIFCLLDPAAIDQLRIGLPVCLAVALLGHDDHGMPCLRPYFTPRTSG
jgi:uncharacterized OB-fold protein